MEGTVFAGVFVVVENMVEAACEGESLVVSCIVEVECTELVEFLVILLVELVVELLVEFLVSVVVKVLVEVLVEVLVSLASTASADQPFIVDNVVCQASAPVKEGV